MKLLPLSFKFNKDNKRHVARLHKILIELEENIKPSDKEVKGREFGRLTKGVLKEFQKKKRIAESGNLDEKTIEKINLEIIKKKYSSKTQISKLHKSLEKIKSIAKIDYDISEDKKKKEIGQNTKNAIKAFQKKYKLKETGELNPETLEMIESVASSRPPPVKYLKVKDRDALRRINYPLRLNMAKNIVSDLQTAMAYLDFAINEKEFRTKKYGRTTRDAVLEFQRKNGLIPTGEVDKTTAALLNNLLSKANPKLKETEKYRVRGSVRDDLWAGKKYVKVQVFEKRLRTSDVKLGERNTLENGFYDIVYDPPKDPVTDKPKETIHLEIKIVDDRGNVIDSKTYYNVGKVHWANFTEGETDYRGVPEFERLMKILNKALEGEKIEAIEESERHKDITHLYAETGVTSEDIMKLSLAHSIANELNQLNILTPEVFYAFLRQNLPPDLPSDLLPDKPDEWGDWISELVENTTNGIVFLDSDILKDALENALTQNYVSRKVSQQKADLLTALNDLRDDFALQKQVLIGKGTLKSLLDVSSVDAALYKDVAKVFLKYWCIDKEFWKAVRTDVVGISDDMVKDFKNTTELGNIAVNHVHTFTFLKGRLDDPGDMRFKVTRDFGKLTHTEWGNLVREGGSKVPDDIDGANDEDKIRNYASLLRDQAERMYPSVTLMADVNRATEHGLNHTQEIAKVIDDHQEFDLKRDNIEKFNKDSGNPLDEDSLQEAKVIQRVHRLAPTSAAGTALLNEKLHSSQQIYFQGKDRFVHKLLNRSVSRSDAVKMFHMAEHQYAHVLARISQYRFDLHRVNPKMIVSYMYSQEEIEEFKKDIPNLEVLFGSLDYCDCKHCQSVYSPAAYVTDLLRFLDEKDSLVGTKSVKDILFERRPDLGNIKLSCENTNTPLPYIDLVCEILENAIPTAQSDFSYQTTLSAQELRATPEYIRPHSYDVLKAAKYPMNISFNLWQEESRIFLNHLGVPRYKLMEAFQDKSDPNAKIPDDPSIAAEYFGISSQEQTIILTKEDNSAKQNEYWGFDSTQNNVTVSTFLKKSKLTYPELLDFLQVEFVNPTVNRSVIIRPVDDCDVDKQSIDKLSLPKLDRMHRFLHLWRRTGWKMWELDLLISSPKIGNSTLNGDCLVNLKRFKELQDSLKLGVEELLSFYGSINTAVRISADPPGKEIKPLYDQLFLNLAIRNPIDEDDPFKLSDGHVPPLIDAGSPIINHISTIISALAISEEDFNRLLSKTNEQLSLESLSILYRYVTLARKLRLPVKDLLLLLNVIGMSDPFLSLEKTRELIRDYNYIDESGMSLTELDYILTYAEDSSVGLRNEVLIQKIETLRNNLSNLQNELLLSNETQRELLKKHLGKFEEFSNEADIDKALDLIEGIWDGDDTTRQTFIDNYFGVFISDLNTAKSTLTTGDLDETAISQRYQYVIDNLYSYLNKNVIKESVASSLNLTNQRADMLLITLSLPGETTNLLTHLQDDRLIEKDEDGEYKNDITEANFPNIYKAFNLVHKISILLEGLEPDIKDLEWFLNNHSKVHVLDLSTLPISSSQGIASFIEWLNWWHLLQFRKRFPEPEHTSFRKILDIASDSNTAKSDIFKELSTLTEWSEDNIEGVDQGLKLKHEVGTLDYTKAETYNRFQKCFDQMRNTGVDAETMFLWANRNDVSLEIPTAQHTRQAAKSKYDTNEWLKKVEPLQDELREKKRSALVEYLIEHSQRNEPEEIPFSGEMIPNPKYWEKANDLFGYYLIDVEMSACQLTSRIKQAISSVQLFIQRCFLNLENRYVQIPKDDPDLENSWSQWKWMKNYRIWEANRKVFLYPENWIEPELRDDKSPFFQELENEILQNEITHDNVEEAFLNYLQKVDEVARLEVCGLYHEDHGSKNVLHVIGRTKTIPAVYYYRYFDLDYSTWSAWEKIEIDITGDHVMPAVYNRKLHLFWLVSNSKPIKIKKNPPAQASSTPTDNPEPPKMLEIQLAWSVRKHKGWTAKRISKQKLIHPWERPLYSYNLKPRYRSADNTLWIDLYISTSREFNERLFYDQYKAPSQARIKLTGSPFDETFRPWHSSSFVFDGDILAVKLRGVPGIYYMPGSNDTQRISSYNYVTENFGEEGRAIAELDYTGPTVKLPSGMHFEYTHLTNNRVFSPNSNKLNILEGGDTKTLLNGAKSPFEVAFSQQDRQFNYYDVRPFFYQDSQRAFFVQSHWEEYLLSCMTRVQKRKYTFYPFYHPYTTLFIRELNRSGLDGLLNRNVQTMPETFYPRNDFNFNSYTPIWPHAPHETAQKDIVDFSFSGAYSIYNWEIFFHAPLMIACKLSQNQRFEEAMRWFHYIFDPTNTDNLPVPQRYWITKPFYEHNSQDYRKQRITNLLEKIEEHSDQIKAWKNNPFKPHLVARYRPVAYQRTVVMKYIDNLIVWGDYLFRRDTIESINEATLLYILAYELLGRRPEKVPAVHREDRTFNELIQEGALDIFGNTKVEVAAENILNMPIRIVPPNGETEPLPRLETSYFCIPNNDKLLEYWDTVEDRLFKIRHCMNIEGLVRRLPLFEPPIEPGLLVKAAAAGVDLGSVLSDLSVPHPHYRSRILIQKAIDFCNEVRTFGEKLLRVLENKDAEALAVLRSSHEIQLLEAVKEVRKLQIKEANETLASLENGMDVIEKRIDYYDNIPRMNDWEIGGAVSHGLAIVSEIVATVLNTVGGVAHLFPRIKAGASGFGGSPHMTLEVGGDNVGKSSTNFAALFQGLSGILHSTGNMLELQGTYTRRDDENKFQKELAEKEKTQLIRQTNAAKFSLARTEKELESHEKQIENAKTEDEYLRNKYTNEQLYNWMITQISSVYFQSYQLAYDIAKRAEKGFRYELGLKDSSYIQFGYWDSLKKGLLAGDKLAHDLRRLEAAYYDQNKRELEITKQISLAQIAPYRLMQLKLTGECMLNLPEWLFDMDYPGHYMRRIKAVSVTIPCIIGPYTNVNCTLSLQKNEVRISNLVGSGYARTDINDDRFVDQLGTIQSVATSHGQNDSGLFELNFSDERFLPFEGAGGISTWKISMPREHNQFDFSTISDFILHIRYTARDGGDKLATEAKTHLETILPKSGVRLLSMKHEFPTEWHRFLYPGQEGADQEFKVDIKDEHFPFYARGKEIKVSKLNIIMDGKHDSNYIMKLQLPGQAEEEYNIGKDSALNNYHHLEQTFGALPSGKGEWTMKVRRDTAASDDFKSLPCEDLVDIFFVVHFEIS